MCGAVGVEGTFPFLRRPFPLAVPRSEAVINTRVQSAFPSNSKQKQAPNELSGF